MFQPLATYLFHYKKLTIPEVGSIELHHQSAYLDVADKLIHPPAYKFIYSKAIHPSTHQLQFVSGYDNKLDEGEELKALGHRINKHIERERFYWKGIGAFQKNNTEADFVPEPVSIGLQPIPANKVMRQHVQHTVLRGETEIISRADDAVTMHRRKRSLVVLIGWILALLALVFIGVYLYQHQFAPETSGTQTKVKPATTAPTYK